MVGSMRRYFVIVIAYACLFHSFRGSLSANFLSYFNFNLFLFVFNLFFQEHLKHCVRDVLSRKRMVAFLLLDSPQESIMDLMVILFICSTTLTNKIKYAS